MLNVVRRGGLIKVLWHDGQGMCLFAKRLERGHFVWPSTVPRDGADRTVTITPAQLGYLLEGIDWRLPQTKCFVIPFVHDADS
jgi:transposase